VTPAPTVTVNVNTANTEPYLCGQSNRVARKGFADGTFIGGAVDAVGGFFVPANGRALFQSDHAFDAFVSPVSNPFYLYDPRALTEVKPLFIYQHVPGTEGVAHGNIYFAGVQGRVALTDRLSFVFSKLGVTWSEVNAPAFNISHHSGFSDLFLGPQYTFIRSDTTCTLLAGGLSFDIGTGSSRVLFREVDDLALRPYLSFGQNFKTGIGDFNFLNTTGFSIGTSNRDRSLFFTSFHVDYDVAGWHKFYPLIELNYFDYFRHAAAANLGLEGRNQLSMAVGARYKFTENIQAGGAFEFPLISPHHFMDYRLTLDMIFRY
jgi:hypothetical protein